MVNTPSDGDRTNKPLTYTKEDLKSILTNPNTMPEERNQILGHLQQIASIEIESGQPFCVVPKEDISSAGLIPLLSTIVPLFEGGDKHKEHLSVFIHNMIISEDVHNLEKVVFIWNPRMDPGNMSPKFGDRINKENNIDMWAEKGNGGYYDHSNIPEYPGRPFVHVSVTEHLISKKPNAVVVVFTQNLNPRHTMLLTGIKGYSPLSKEQLDGLWDMTHEEIVDRYYTPSEDDY